MQKNVFGTIFQTTYFKMWKKYNYVFSMYVYIYIYIYFFFSSGKFLTSTIILLIFIKGVHVREKGGKERKNKKRKRWVVHQGFQKRTVHWTVKGRGSRFLRSNRGQTVMMS